MARDLLTDTRFLLARAGTSTPPTFGEILAERERLAAMRAHPSCPPERAERIGGALVVLDVLALVREDVELAALAG